MKRSITGLNVLFLVLMFVGCKPPEDPNAVANQDDGPVEMERVKAEAGVGKQGQVIGDKEGFLRTPAKALFTAKQKIAFMSVEHALNLYKAEHDAVPKTHDEFMDKIVKFNNIQLPELPEGQKYIWDPEQGELMVEKPKS